MPATNPLSNLKLLTHGLGSAEGEGQPFVNAGLLSSGISSAISLSATAPPVRLTGQDAEGRGGIVNLSAITREPPPPRPFRPAIGSGISRVHFEDEFVGTFTYTGADVRVFATLAGDSSQSKQLVELTTITVSVHREKVPVRTCGLINPAGFARGRRTIAGTMILTQFWMDSLFRFLKGSPADTSLDSFFKKPDQLPALDLTFIFSDEFGHVSTRSLMGVELLTDGTVYSVNDMITEQTISFIASDFTPLMPIYEKVIWDSEDVELPDGTVSQTAPMSGRPETPASHMRKLHDLTAAPSLSPSNQPYVRDRISLPAGILRRGQ